MAIQFVLRRMLHTIVVLFAVSLLAFCLTFIAGDPVTLMAGENWTPEEVTEFRHRLGLDRPWYEQYGSYIARLVTGDLGTSLRQQRPVFDLITERLPATLELTLSALVLSTFIAFPIGVLSATRRNSLLDQLVMGLAVLAQAMPVFWLGIMLILIFSVGLRWTPVGGRTGAVSLVLPVLSLSALYIARNARLVRSSLLEVLAEDYVRTARAKGLNEQSVLYRHALRNALIPVVTMIGLQFGHLLGGAVITETVFAWPGVGRLIVQSVLSRDPPLVQGAVIIIAGFVVFVNLVVDFVYGWIDPRARIA